MAYSRSWTDECEDVDGFIDDLRTSSIMNYNVYQCLSNTFGGIPSVVQEHTKYFIYEDEDFSCKLCNKVIHKDSPITLENHIKSISHRDSSCSMDETRSALMKTFYGKIPQIVCNNIIILDVIEEGYECAICDKIINVSRDTNISTDNFSYHLKSFGHGKKLEDYYNRLDVLVDVYGGIPQVVANNIEFLEFDICGQRYVCTLCNVTLKVHRSNMEKTKIVFKEHFYSHEHIFLVRKSKVLSLVPELQHSKSEVHTFLTRNIDYLHYNNEMNIFCFLCHENIKRNPYDVNETEENLKYHLLSVKHKKNAFSRQNQNNVKLCNLSKVMGVFSDEVLTNLRCLELINDSLCCVVCDVEFDKYDYDLLQFVVSHIESDDHMNNISQEEEKSDSLIESLDYLCGKIPDVIEENFDHIFFDRGNIFQCLLCNVKFHQNNLTKHFQSKRHTQRKIIYDEATESLSEKLEEVFGQNFRDVIPDCIFSNWHYIDYIQSSGNFQCSICDETIFVNDGSKAEEITIENFKRHLFSASHVSELKEIANEQTKTSEKLESIYGGIPKCILNNLNFLFQSHEDSFYCEKCNVEIRFGSSARTTAQNFLQHLRGFTHKSNIEAKENSIDCAFEFLEETFSVPERLLNNIDFWENAYNFDIHCSLCQKDIVIDDEDLKLSRLFLESHIDSSPHRKNLLQL